MGDPVELILDGPVNLPLPVTVEIYPERGASVEIFIPVDVEEVVALSPLNNEGCLPLPLLHLSEGVPDMPLIEPLESVGFLTCHSEEF